jgi:two-component system CheB/CheR fusion protein
MFAGPGKSVMSARKTALAEFSRRLVLDAYTPAAVLINAKHECLHFSGPVERYLRVPRERSTCDLIAIAHPGMRAKLKSAIQQSIRNSTRVVVSGARIGHHHASPSFSIDVRPVVNDGENLLLVCFYDEPQLPPRPGRPGRMAEAHEIVGPMLEYGAMGTVPEAAIHRLGIFSEKRNADDSEAAPLNSDSRKELRLLSEKLAALNDQLREARERERITSNDLQNMSYSIDVATLFLDASLNIRFFTPATKSQSRVIPNDIGWPLSDLNSMTSDGNLIADAQAVLQSHEPIEREIQTQVGTWYIRRILPYRTHDGEVEGVVITFTDTTERKLAARALEAAQRQAESANAMRSRFLAAVSHYLRQPLQTLALLQGLLAKKFEGDAAQKMVALLDQTLSAMSGMLNTLIDIDQIDAGIVSVETKHFPVNDLLARLRDEFGYHAQVQGLTFRVISSSLSVRSDPHLLEQVIRTLLTNALKNTKRGKILLGCRRRGSMLSIEILDTGVGIPESEIQAVFAEPHQFDSILNERSRGFGLSMVQRLASLLKHRLTIRARLGKGSFFAIEVPLLPSETELQQDFDRIGIVASMDESARRTGTILVIEDDPEAYELLELFLKEEGHAVATARDEIAALEMVARGSIRPDLVLVDYNLLNGMDGLHVTAKLREKFFRRIPIIVLTGDTSVDALQEIAAPNCVQLNKPVRAAELTQVIQRLLPAQQSALEQTWETNELPAWRETAVQHLGGLTARQHQIMKLVLAGYPSKNIAADLGISRRTVENHRASIMKKTGAKSLPELARLALAADLGDQGEASDHAPPPTAEP